MGWLSKDFIAEAPLAERLEGLSLEERMQGAPLEDVMQQFSLEELRAFLERGEEAG